MIWLALPRRPAHAFWIATATRSVCGVAVVEKPAGDFREGGPLPRRERDPADPCAHCLLAIERRVRRVA